MDDKIPAIVFFMFSLLLYIIIGDINILIGSVIVIAILETLFK